ncbi:MAG: H-type lectin domain-containing protein [Rubellimicrobium sp.]|nr:H-type lectin domain-containing protein [Rubellimicrobium sp.]
MMKIQAHAIGIDGGQIVLFDDFEGGGPMWTGDGPREVRRAVRFAEPFLRPPAVQVTLTMWDIASGANDRVDVAADEVGCDGFTLRFRTWGDTRIARIRVGWQAIGALRDDDDWEVP